MDPFSLSLLSLGVSSMAVRRIIQAMETAADASLDEAPKSIRSMARKLLTHAIAETSVRRAQGEEADASVTLAELSCLPNYPALVVERNVPLNVLFEVDGEDVDDAVSLMSRRKIDAVIYDATGMAVAALCQPRRRTDPPPLVRQMFELTGLPLICVPASCDWQDGLNRVNGAFASGKHAA